MSYTIKLRIRDNKRNRVAAVEELGWHYANGGKWSEVDDGFLLTMGGSGTSGMIRFRSTNFETFVIVVGVHNYKRWCDIKVNLEETATAHAILRLYYGDTTEYKRLWAQAISTKATTSKGNEIKINFTVAEGHDLAADLIYAEGPGDEAALEVEPLPDFGNRH